jgi:hypothetical protein
MSKELIEQLAKKHGHIINNGKRIFFGSMDKLEAFAKAYQAAINNKGDYKEYSQEDAPANYQHTEAFAWASGAMHGYVEGYQAAAPIDNVAEAEVCDEKIDTEAVADAKKLWKALNDLSFDCFAGLGVRTPSLKVYNETFKVMDSYRSTYGALIPTQAKKG